MTDATRYENHMHFPTDMKLLWECVELLHRYIRIYCGEFRIRRLRNKYDGASKAYLSYCKKRKKLPSINGQGSQGDEVWGEGQQYR